jgi:hypothetical protein
VKGSRAGALVMAGLLVLYLVVVVQLGVTLVGTGEPVTVVIGVALLVLPVVGAWALVSELIFVARGNRLIRQLGQEGGLPVDDLPRLPSGRIDPLAADAEFPRYRAAVEASPNSWREWVRLALAYDASGDRGRARWAMRRAIRLTRTRPE